MLWTEKYRPATFEDIIGQRSVIRHLASFAQNRSVPHLLLAGQHGTGKTSAIECFARHLYADNWAANTSIFHTADLFLSGKNYLEQDERYAHLYRKQDSLLTNFKYIIRSYAAMRPLDASFKLMVFEDAHVLPREAQQALRRTMERASGTCRFILSTTNQSAIIPAISSRCLPLFFAQIDGDLMLARLKEIRRNESSNPGMHPCDDEQLELIVHISKGDLRRAILLLQLAMQSGMSGDPAAIAQSETATVAASALSAVQKGDLRIAIREIDSLMIDYGLSGSEVLQEIRPVIRREYNDPSLSVVLAEADVRIRHCNNEFVQLASFVADMREVLS
ncbi:MAG: Replication factor C small subunit [Methanoregula sp. PtaU1.Bin051]|nr:MAG: Replication factor C small subunit [Methanoregula sp. PtaU1.Bin051]